MPTGAAKLGALVREFGADIANRIGHMADEGFSWEEMRQAAQRLVGSGEGNAPAKAPAGPERPAAPPRAPRTRKGANAGPPAKKGILATPDLRVQTTQQAIKTARRKPHLIQTKTGEYVGGPAGVKGPRGLGVMRRNFDRDVAAGAEGGDWYTRARASNVDWAGPDPARQQLLADEQALWSAQANPDTNLNFALQAHNAYEAGRPLEQARTGQQARTYNTARDLGERIPLGPKTGIYGQHLDPTAPHATTGTNDIWHARGFGYTQPDKDMFSRALTDQEHRFLDYETMMAVDRANKNQLAGRDDWQAHEIQAAPWVAGKGRGIARQLAKAARGEGAEPTEEELAEGIRRAALTYPDYADKYTAFATGERVPYVGSGHLSGITTGDDALRAAYSSDPARAWTDEGRDAIYDALGMYQRQGLDATGAYTPPGGVLENNPVSVARPLVGITGGEVDPASRELLDLAESLRAYTDVQGAGAWHKNIQNAKPGEMGSVFIPQDSGLPPEMLQQLREVGNRYGLGDAVDTGQGVTMTSFYPGPPGGAETGKALRGDLGLELESLLPGSKPGRSKVDSGYLPMFEEPEGETFVPGSGVVTRRLRDLVSQYPESVIDRLDASQSLRDKYLSRLYADEAAARAGHGSTREDAQTARRLLGEGGLRGLFSGLDRGVALPSIVAPMGLSAYWPQEDDGSGY